MKFEIIASEASVAFIFKEPRKQKQTVKHKSKLRIFFIKENYLSINVVILYVIFCRIGGGNILNRTNYHGRRKINNSLASSHNRYLLIIQLYSK